MSEALCKPMFCDFLEPIYCRQTLQGEDTFSIDVPEWILCLTKCEFLHVHKVECGKRTIWVPGEILVEFVYFDGLECKYGSRRVPANFTFPNPCVGLSERVFECSCGQPAGRCLSAEIQIDRDPVTGKRRKARVIARVAVTLEICCLVDVECQSGVLAHC